MKLTKDQRDALTSCASELEDAKARLEHAKTKVPVVGDAELHCLRLDLEKVIRRVDHLAEIAEEIGGQR